MRRTAAALGCGVLSSKDRTRQFVLFVNRDEEAFTPAINAAVFAVASAAYCG